MKISIAHIHVWDKTNKGDAGIVEAVQYLLGQQFPEATIVDVPVDQLKTADEGWLAKINSCDLVVIGGGGVYYRYFLPYNTDFVDRITPPIVLFGVGYINEFGAPPLSTAEIQSVIHLNQRAKLASVRDLNTKRFLTENGYLGDSTIIGDPAVFLPEKKVELSKAKINIGFNLNYSGWLGFGKYQDKIIASYREAMDYFSGEVGAKLFYLVHHPGEYDIIPKLQRKFEVIDLPPQEQKYAYGQMDTIVGMMLHLSVMAFGAGTPITILAYDIRNLGFAEFIEHPELVVLPENLSAGTLRSKMQLTFEKRDEYRKDFILKKQKMTTTTNDYLKKISELVKPK
jgi:polysaccharide pyruvyl transferase WcaK-like protein